VPRRWYVASECGDSDQDYSARHLNNRRALALRGGKTVHLRLERTLPRCRLLLDLTRALTSTALCFPKRDDKTGDRQDFG
jgi:hypothetical protein